jgi:hypothetical protein
VLLYTNSFRIVRPHTLRGRGAADAGETIAQFECCAYGASDFHIESSAVLSRAHFTIDNNHCGINVRADVIISRVLLRIGDNGQT